MATISNELEQGNNSVTPKEYEGIYGKYQIDKSDIDEVQKYRISLMCCGISFSLGLIQWTMTGPAFAWIWLIPMCLSMGYSLKLIHIYLRPLHLLLQILWFIGVIDFCILGFTQGPNLILTSLSEHRILVLFIGPLFAALTGIGFKEFFCFRRIEAIGLTLLLPITLLGHLFGLINTTFTMIFLLVSAILLVLLSWRKFGLDASLDIGDKSVFNYMKKGS